MAVCFFFLSHVRLPTMSRLKTPIVVLLALNDAVILKVATQLTLVWNYFKYSHCEAEGRSQPGYHS